LVVASKVGIPVTKVVASLMDIIWVQAKHWINYSSFRQTLTGKYSQKYWRIRNSKAFMRRYNSRKYMVMDISSV